MFSDLSNRDWNTSIWLRVSFVFFNFYIAATIRYKLIALFWLYSCSLCSSLLLALPLSRSFCRCHSLLHEHLLLLFNSLIVFREVFWRLFAFLLAPLIVTISTSISLSTVTIVYHIIFIIHIDVVASYISINLRQKVWVWIYHEFWKLTRGLNWSTTLWLWLVSVGFLRHQGPYWQWEWTCWVQLRRRWQSIRLIMLAHSVVFLLHSSVVLSVFIGSTRLNLVSENVSCR